MRYLVVYDIEPNKVRTRVAKVLEGYGQRVQKSVFECDLDDVEISRLSQELAMLLAKSQNGGIRIYRICERCVAGSWVIGEEPGGKEQNPHCIVFD